MRNGRITLNQVFNQIAQIIRAEAHETGHEPDTSPTTIRTKVNDMLDYWDKGGFRVNHDYNQPRAIRIVRNLVRSI